MNKLYKVELEFDAGINRWTATFFNKEGFRITFVLLDSTVYKEDGVLAIDSSVTDLLALNFVFAAQRDAEMKKAAKERPSEGEKGPV